MNIYRVKRTPIKKKIEFRSFYMIKVCSFLFFILRVSKILNRVFNNQTVNN